MTDYYVIGDVHGKAGMLEDLLKHGMVRLNYSFLEI